VCNPLLTFPAALLNLPNTGAGVTATWSCPAGTGLADQPTKSTCSSDGEWEPARPTCISLPCADPKASMDGSGLSCEGCEADAFEFGMGFFFVLTSDFPLGVV
jgi:hypothetical protein